MSLWTVLPVAIAAALPISTIAAREVQRRVQPARLELARRGEEALKRDDLSPEAKNSIEFMLETAFGMRGLLVGTLVIIPAVAVGLVFSAQLRRSVEKSTAAYGRDQDLQEIDALHSALMLANNPVLTPLSVFWIAAWIVPALMIGRLFNGKSPPSARVTENDVMRYVERRALARAPLAASVG